MAVLDRRKFPWAGKIMHFQQSLKPLAGKVGSFTLYLTSHVSAAASSSSDCQVEDPLTVAGAKQFSATSSGGPFQQLVDPPEHYQAAPGSTLSVALAFGPEQQQSTLGQKANLDRGRDKKRKDCAFLR